MPTHHGSGTPGGVRADRTSPIPVQPVEAAVFVRVAHVVTLAVAAIALLLSGGCTPVAVVQTEHPGIPTGRALYDVGRYEDAEAHFRSLLADAEAAHDLVLEAQCGKWIGNILLVYKKDDEALRWYTRSLSRIDSVLARESAATVGSVARRERSNILSNITAVFRNRGEVRRAAALLADVLRDDIARGEALPIAVSYTNLAILHDQLAADTSVAGDEVAGRAHHDSARTLYRRALATYPTADAWLGLGGNHADVDELDSAIACFRRAEGMYRASGFRVHEALCLGNIGILLERMSRGPEAIDALRSGIGILEELRGNLSTIDIRSSFISNKFHLYERLIGLLVAAGRTGEAFEYVERAKARSFLDMLGNKRVGSDKLRSVKAQQLVDEERALQERMTALLEMPDSTAALSEVTRRHRDVLVALRSIDPEYASVKSIDPVSVDSLRALLDERTGVLEYFLGEDAAMVFVVRRDRVTARMLPFRGTRDIAASIDALRRELYVTFPNERTRVLREARLNDGLSAADARARWYATVTDGRWQFRLVELYGKLMAPVECDLEGITRLYVVPHGPLHHLPFGALVRPADVDRDRTRHIPRPVFLAERCELAWLPSASVLPFAMRRATAPPDRALVVGDPSYADPVYRRKPLPSALIEADSVARYVSDPLVLTRDAAEEERVKREVKGRGLLHFATHGELNRKDPLRSRILFAARNPSGDNDGNLTVAEVFNMDLDASLVTLSACQTAQVAGGTGAVGDDLVGLTRSFLYAGTPSVVATLWYVDDAATLAWMNAFYRAWLMEGNLRSTAAARAAGDMLAAPKDPDWVHPYFWAAFILFGAM